MGTLYCTATHITGTKLYVELTHEQAHSPSDTWSDERVLAFEDSGDKGQLFMHDVRLADLDSIALE